jgi:hypothetical protein
VGLPEDRAVEQAPEESIAVVEPRAVARAGLLRMLRRARAVTKRLPRVQYRRELDWAPGIRYKS